MKYKLKRKGVFLVILIVLLLSSLFLFYFNSDFSLTGSAVGKGGEDVSLEGAFQAAQSLGLLLSLEGLENDLELQSKILGIKAAREEHEQKVMEKQDSDAVNLGSSQLGIQSEEGSDLFISGISASNLSGIVNASLVDISGTIIQILFDDNTYSYADGTSATPNLYLKICAENQSVLLNKYAATFYSVGDRYFITTSFAQKITSDEIGADNCTRQDIDFSSGKALYPGRQSFALSDSPSFSGSLEMCDLNLSDGFMNGSFSYDLVQTGIDVSVNITGITDHEGDEILTDFERILVGLRNTSGDVYTVNVTSRHDIAYLTQEAGDVPEIVINGLVFDETGFVTDSCGVLNRNTELVNNVNSTDTCFTINASDIVLDCGGHIINYSVAGIKGYGVNNSGGYDNVTIRNCNIYEGNETTLGKYAVYFYNTSNGTIENNNISVIGEEGHGVYLKSSNSSILNDNVINANGEEGYGIYLDNSLNSKLSNNKITAMNSGGKGIYLYLSSNSNLTSNIINTNGSSGFGIYLFSNSNSNTLISNTINTSGNNGYGMYLQSSSSNNVLLNNNISAINANEIYDITGNTDRNYLIYNNSFGEIRWIDDSDGGFLKNLTVDGEIGLGTNLFIGNNTAALNTSAFGSNPGINSSANITLRGLSLVSVSVIKRFGNYSTNSSEILAKGVDCVGTICWILDYNSSTDILLFNTSYFSSFAGSAVDVYPYWQNNQTSIVSIYSPTTQSYFNITWQNSYGVSMVWLESNYSGNAQNYSMNNITASVYNYSSVLPAGTHYWKSYANDTADQWNVSDIWSFTIAKAAGALTLYINGSTDDFRQNVNFDINITCILTTPSSGNITIYENGVELNSTIDSTVSYRKTYSTSGDYNITCSFLDHQNYTASDYSWVNATSPEVTPVPSVGGGGRVLKKPQCNDNIDNDADGLIDEDDPGCHVDNDLGEAYLRNKDSEDKDIECTEDRCEGILVNKCENRFYIKEKEEFKWEPIEGVYGEGWGCVEGKIKEILPPPAPPAPALPAPSVPEAVEEVKEVEVEIPLKLTLGKRIGQELKGAGKVTINVLKETGKILIGLTWLWISLVIILLCVFAGIYSYRVRERKKERLEKALELRQFIVNQLIEGISKKEVKVVLTGKGWPKDIVDEYVEDLVEKARETKRKIEEEKKVLEKEKRRGLEEKLSDIDKELKRIELEGLMIKGGKIKEKEIRLKKENKRKREWRNELRRRKRMVERELERLEENESYLGREKILGFPKKLELEEKKKELPMSKEKVLEEKAKERREKRRSKKKKELGNQLKYIEEELKKLKK